MAVYAVNAPTTSATASAAVVQIDEPRYLGTQMRGDTALTDSDGVAFTLAEMLGKPLILLLSYYGCDGTCPTMNMELARVLADVDKFKIGEDYRVLTVSFDAKDTAQTAADFIKKTAAVPQEMQSGWRHAVLQNKQIEAFTGEIGYRFFWSDAARAFMHPNVLIFLTPQGRVARYIYGTRMDAETIELALIDADWNRISNSAEVFDILVGACFSYNYVEGRYQPNYAQIIGVGSLLFGLALMAYGAWVYRRGKARKVHV